jgi:hypothetical protein
MADKKKAYRRFEQMTRRAMAPTPAETGPDRGSADGGEAGPPPDEALTIRLSPELRRALERQAAIEGTTPTEIVEQALRRYLQRWR